MCDDPVKVFLVAEGWFVIQAFRSELDVLPNVRFVGVVTLSRPNDGSKCSDRELQRVTDIAASADCDVVCIEGVTLDGSAVTELVVRLANRKDCAPLLVVTRPTTADLELLALQSGAHGVVMVDDDPGRLSDAVQLVAAGYLVRSATPTLPNNGHATQSSIACPAAESFTSKEIEVLIYLVRGMTNTEIAKSVNMSTIAVKALIQRMRIRLGLDNRASLAAYALQVGVTRPDIVPMHGADIDPASARSQADNN